MRFVDGTATAVLSWCGAGALCVDLSGIVSARHVAVLRERIGAELGREVLAYVADYSQCVVTFGAEIAQVLSDRYCALPGAVICTAEVAPLFLDLSAAMAEVSRTRRVFLSPSRQKALRWAAARAQLALESAFHSQNAQR